MNGFEYGNARVRAMRSRLLTPADYTQMIGADALDRMLALLADTTYGPDVEAALVRASGLERLDQAVRTNLAGTLHKIASFYSGRPGQMVSLLLSRWDLRNLRTVIRMAEASMPTGEPGRLLIPAGHLSEAELAELAGQRDLASLVDLMVSWRVPSPEAVPELLRARAELTSGGDVSVLESIVSQTYAARLRAVLGEELTGAVSILRAEIDAHNLEIALRARAARLAKEPSWPEQPNQYLPGGMVPVTHWGRLAEADAQEEVVSMAALRAPLPGWAPALSNWATTGRLADLSDRLRRAITSAAVARFVTGDPLGFDIPLAYTFAKEAEARNLHLIGRGLVHRIPAQDVEDRLEVAA